jgi:membrane protein
MSDTTIERPAAIERPGAYPDGAAGHPDGAVAQAEAGGSYPNGTGVHADGTGRHRAATVPEPGVRELAVRLGQAVVRLARAEAYLAALEGKQRARQVAAGAGMFGAAGLAAFFGFACLVEAFILGLSNVIQPWFAALIAAAALFLLALFIVLPGWRGVTQSRPVTTDVRDSVKQDVELARRLLAR